MEEGQTSRDLVEAPALSFTRFATQSPRLGQSGLSLVGIDDIPRFILSQRSETDFDRQVVPYDLGFMLPAKHGEYERRQERRDREWQSTDNSGNDQSLPLGEEVHPLQPE